MNRLTTTIAIAAIAASLAAQENQPVQHATQRERAGQLSVGYTDILDTYLSQEKFTGTEFGYLSQSLSRRDSSHIVRETVHHVLVGVAGTRGNDNSLLTLLYNLRLGWMYRWHWAAPRLTLLAGGAIDGTLGGAYDTRNSNNPAQARIALSIDPTARLSWQLRTGRHPLALHYDVTLPLIGMAFSPNYGQSYYEIFSRGNYDHNIVCRRIPADESQQPQIPPIHPQHHPRMVLLIPPAYENHRPPSPSLPLRPAALHSLRRRGPVCR